MPEGDAVRRAADRLATLAGDRVEASAPNPRGTLVARAVDGRVLERVDAVGKNLLLRFEGGVVVHSHLGMKGRWRVAPVGAASFGRPWLVLRGSRHEALQWNGPVLELAGDARRRLGPDILAAQPDFDRMVANLRGLDPSTPLGRALQHQRSVAGIGNMWAAETLWAVRLSPWLQLAETADDELRAALRHAQALMRAGLDGRRGRREAYRRAGRPCRRCGAAVRSRGQGDDNRTAYWCPGCQRGGGDAAAGA